MNRVELAKLCHETNRGYCAGLGDLSQVSWEDAPEWQRESALKGVDFHLAAIARGEGAKPAASHESWLAEKERTGWKYGPVKDAERKEHPCFVPFIHLPTEQRAKDVLFCALCEHFALDVLESELRESNASSGA